MNWFGDKQGHGFEYHLLAIALAVVVIVHGVGAFSLDRVLYRHLASPEVVPIEFHLFVLFFFRAKPQFSK